MTLQSGYDLNEAVLLMTLSDFAYIDRRPLPGETVAQQQARMRQDIDTALSASAHSDWQVSWGPGLNDDRSNMMYAAASGKTGQCAVIVRGTDFSFVLDWLQDFGAVLGLVRFPYSPSSAGSTIKIAAGTAVGLNQLVTMSGMTPSGAQQDLATYLQGLGPDREVFVTGHSLGGGLASVLALFLADKLGGAGNMKVYTFAAPSAGNAAFAAYYNTTFKDANGTSTAFRVYNTLDIVPDAWMSLAAVEALYDPAPKCTDELKLLIGLAATFVGHNYVQVGTEQHESTVPLPGKLVPPALALFHIDPQGDVRFFNEVSEQHATSMYLHLLGAPTATATIVKLRGILQNQAADGGRPTGPDSPPAETSG